MSVTPAVEQVAPTAGPDVESGAKPGIRRSLAWMSLAQGSAFVLQFGASVVLARHLTPYEMGIFALAVGIVGTLALLQAFGLQSLIVREAVLTPEVESTAFSINVVIAILLSLLIAGVSVLGAKFVGEPGVRRVLLVLAVLPLLGAFEFLPISNIERRGDFRTMALVTLASSLVSALLTVAFALRGYSYMSIAYAQLSASTVSAVAYGVVGRRYMQARLSFAGWRSVARHGAQMMALYGVANVGKRVSDLLLGKLLGLGALGLYTRASNLNDLIWNNVHLTAGRVVFVDFATMHREGLSLRGRYLQVTEVVTCLLWPAFAAFAILSPPLIRAVFGQPWVPAAGPLALLSVTSMVLVSITMTWELFVATGQMAAQTRIEFIRAGFGLAVFGAACTISLQAAAAARVVEAIFAVIVYRPHLSRMTGTQTRDFWPIYARSALTTGLAIVPAAALMLFHHGSADVALTQVAAAVALGAAFWGAGLVWLGHPLASEIAGIWRRFRRLGGQA